MTCVSPWREYNFSLHCLRMYAHNKKPDCCQYVFECVFRWEGGRVCSSVRKPDSWMNLLCYFGLFCLIPDRVAGTKLNATSFLQKKVKKINKWFLCSWTSKPAESYFCLILRSLNKKHYHSCVLSFWSVFLCFFKAEFW